MVLAPHSTGLKMTLAGTALLLGWLFAVTLPGERPASTGSTGVSPMTSGLMTSPLITSGGMISGPMISTEPKGGGTFCLDGLGACGYLAETRTLDRQFYRHLLIGPNHRQKTTDVSDHSSSTDSSTPENSNKNRVLSQNEDFAAKYRGIWAASGGRSADATPKISDKVPDELEPVPKLAERDSDLADGYSAFPPEGKNLKKPTDLRAVEGDSDQLARALPPGGISTDEMKTPDKLAEDSLLEHEKGPAPEHWPSELAVTHPEHPNFPETPKPDWKDEIEIATLADGKSGGSGGTDSPLAQTETKIRTADHTEPTGTSPNEGISVVSVVEAISGELAGGLTNEKNVDSRRIDTGISASVARPVEEESPAIEGNGSASVASVTEPLPLVSSLPTSPPPTVTRSTGPHSAETRSAVPPPSASSVSQVGSLVVRRTEPDAKPILALPAPVKLHTVEPGETVAMVAERYGLDVDGTTRLLNLNQGKLGPNNGLTPGSRLILPPQ